MDEIEAIEIKPYLFRDGAVRGWGRGFRHLDDQGKISLLEEAFMSFSPTIKGLSNYLEYRNSFDDNGSVVLKKENERLKSNYACAYYPENFLEDPYFEFDIDHKEKNGRLEKIMLLFKESQSAECSISLWLQQKLINMYPDFGGFYLWFNGGAGDIEDLEEYDFSNTDLPDRLKAWSKLFDKMDDDPKPDWETFNSIGKSIHEELQQIVKERYIIVYCKSFEETNGNIVERDKMEKT
jgi:hypothetical protein